MSEIKEFFKQKKRQIIIGLVVIVLVFVVSILLVLREKKQEGSQRSQTQITEKERQLREAMDQVAWELKNLSSSERQVREEMAEAGEGLKNLPPPSSEDMKGASDFLQQEINKQK